MFPRYIVGDERRCVDRMLTKACPHPQMIQLLFFKVFTQRYCILCTTTKQNICLKNTGPLIHFQTTPTNWAQYQYFWQKKSCLICTNWHLAFQNKLKQNTFSFLSLSGLFPHIIQGHTTSSTSKTELCGAVNIKIKDYLKFFHGNQDVLLHCKQWDGCLSICTRRNVIQHQPYCRNSVIKKYHIKTSKKQIKLQHNA